MKVVFIGAVQFSAKCLEVVYNSSAKIVGVCTLKDSLFNSDHQDLLPIAKNFNIPIIVFRIFNVYCNIINKPIPILQKCCTIPTNPMKLILQEPWAVSLELQDSWRIGLTVSTGTVPHFYNIGLVLLVSLQCNQ